MIDKLRSFNPLTQSQEIQSDAVTQSTTESVANVGIASASDRFETASSDAYSALLQQAGGTAVTQRTDSEGTMIDAASIFDRPVEVAQPDAVPQEGTESLQALRLKMKELQNEIKALQAELESAVDDGDDDRIAEITAKMRSLSEQINALQQELISKQEEIEKKLQALQEAAARDENQLRRDLNENTEVFQPVLRDSLRENQPFLQWKPDDD